MKLDEYERMFEWNGKITCLHSELFLKGTHGVGDPLIIFSNDIWYTFLNKEKKELCSKHGIELYKDKIKYGKYAKEFREYIKTLKLIEVEDIDKNKLIELIDKISKLWEFYGITEYYFTDSAYHELKKTGNKILEANLSDLGKLKIEGREALNYLVFEDGLLSNLLNLIGGKFLDNSSDAFYLYSDELISLFDGKKILQADIDKRKKSYAIEKINSKITKYDYDSACKLAVCFLKKEDATLVKGLIANKGKVSGKVIIAPMFTNSKQVEDIISRMEKNDILIAESTTPEFMILIGKAAGIVTNQGGLLSHAAIVSREFNIPCIVGTKNATKIFKDGDIVEVDAHMGIVKKIG